MACYPHTAPSRCAIYTRRSVKGALVPDGGSIELQHDLCSAWIRSQAHRRWVAVGTRYDDEGYSGGTTERPSLRRLIGDIEQGQVDVVVIYKLDRLTRSLGDFIRLADLFEQYGVTFVSVTQTFDTQDSMGRMVLNILLTFAQFEREMIADRIRDKMWSMKRAGRWTGGAPPYGYDVIGGKLVVNATEAIVVRSIFERYLELGSANQVSEAFRARGLQAKSWINRAGTQSGGGLATRGMINSILGNPVYIGEFHLRGETFTGLHEPIVPRELWVAASDLREARRLRKPPVRPEAHLLLGLLFDGAGRRMKIDQGVKEGRAYRYYISDNNHIQTRRGLKQLRARASELEELIRSAVATFLRRRFEVSGAVHMLGVRDEGTDRLVDNAPLAARRLETFDRRRLRHAWEALIERIEVSRETIRVLLGCEQLAEFLAWRGTGLFRQRGPALAGTRRIHVLEVDAIAVRSERTFRLPIAAQQSAACKPDPGLVKLMRLARRIQETVYENRHLSIGEVAKRFRRRPAWTARVLRLNYLAPDIIAAIMDGTQPPDLTRQKLVFASLPMDWPQQRALFGFPARHDPGAREIHY